MIVLIAVIAYISEILKRPCRAGIGIAVGWAGKWNAMYFYFSQAMQSKRYHEYIMDAAAGAEGTLYRTKQITSTSLVCRA